MVPGSGSCDEGHPYAVCGASYEGWRAIAPEPVPDRNQGKPVPCDDQVGNPVNVATGNKYEEVLDLAVATPGIPLEFRRSYNSAVITNGPLGYGWTHNFNMALQVVQTTTPMRVKIQDADGRMLYFSEVSQTSTDIFFQGESGVKDRLRQVISSGLYYLSRKEGNLIYEFGSDGKLVQISDPNGNTLDFTYNSGHLTQVYNNFGKTLTIQYTTSDRISSVTDPRSQYISYSSTDGNGNLNLVTYPDSRSLSYVYSNHLLTDKYDTNSNLIGHWGYDTAGRVSTHYRYIDNNVHQEEIGLSYNFSQNPPIIAVTRSTGTTTYTARVIDGIAVPIATDGCGGSCGGVHKSYEYDGHLNLGEVTYTSGGQTYTTQYTYDNPSNPQDQIGEVLEKREALGRTEERATTYTYTHRQDDPFLLTQKTESQTSVANPSQNKVITTGYDSYGNVSSRAVSGYAFVNGTATQKTLTTSYSYNSAGQLTQINGPRTDVTDTTTFAYYDNTSGQGNNRAQLYSITDALNHVTYFSNYDANGNVGTITDPNNVVTTYTYDARNRIATSTVASGSFSAQTQFGYDARGNLSYVIPPEGNRIDFSYNLADKLTQITDHLGNYIEYHYDVEGNRDSEKIYDPGDVLKKQLDFVYDQYNRLYQVVNPDSTYTQYTYDDRGNRTAIRDPRNKTTTLGYDALNRLTTITQPGTVITQQGFDTQDNLTSVTNPLSAVTQHWYDDFGKKNVASSLDTEITDYAYDEAGNLTQRIDGKGNVVNYTYDALNRMTSIQFPLDTTQNVTFTYDTYATNDPPPSTSFGIGRLTKRVDPSGTYIFYYDAQGNLTTERKTVNSVLYITQYGYNRNKTLTSITYPSGRVVTYTRDTADRISQVDTTLSGNTTTVASSITCLPFGPITGLTYGNNLALVQTYDTQYRTSTITVGSVLNLTYDHDEAGNVTSLTDANNTPSVALLENPTEYYYDGSSNKLTHSTGSTVTYFNHDQNGNMAQENNRTFVYDLSNQLVSVLNNGSQIAAYTYNGAGQRIKKVTSSTRIFHYDTAGHIIAETDGSGNMIAEYVYLGDQLLALITGGSIYYYHNDHLGTPRVLTNASANIAWSALYTAFGQAQITTQSVTNPFRLPGQYYDTETGLHYNYFRYYNPDTGRYVTPDPIGLEGGVNLYVYTANNPLARKDPSGLWTVGIGLGGTAGAGAAVSGSGMLVMDGYGNVGIAVSGGGGGMGGVSASAGLTAQVTNANTIYELGGLSAQTGFSINIPGSLGLGALSIGGEFVTGPGYTGFNVNLGLAGGGLTFMELHSLVEYAAVGGRNVWDILQYLKDLLNQRKLCPR
jgi:RHS repeat-associated protein